MSRGSEEDLFMVRPRSGSIGQQAGENIKKALMDTARKLSRSPLPEGNNFGYYDGHYRYDSRRSS